jgi:hypothetical protein
MKSLLLQILLYHSYYWEELATRSASNSDSNPFIALAIIIAIIAVFILCLYCISLYEKWYLIPRGKCFDRYSKGFKIVPLTRYQKPDLFTSA